LLRASLASTSLAKNAILDGEIIVLDSNGVSQFNSLLSRKGEDIAVFYAFDLLWVNHTDLRQLPLLERKKQLHELVQKSRCQRLLCTQHIDGIFGKQFFEQICARDLEGIVAKRKLGIYEDDGNTWLKLKNKNYSQAEGRHEQRR
jgi:bifunctional non-homologous end joining protein LigD